MGQVGFSFFDSFLDECRLGCRRPVLLELLNQNRLLPLQQCGIPDNGFVGCGPLFGFKSLCLVTMDDAVSGQRTPYGKADSKEKHHRESRINRGDEFLHGCYFCTPFMPMFWHYDPTAAAAAVEVNKLTHKTKCGHRMFIVHATMGLGQLGLSRRSWDRKDPDGARQQTAASDLLPGLDRFQNGNGPDKPLRPGQSTKPQREAASGSFGLVKDVCVSPVGPVRLPFPDHNVVTHMVAFFTINLSRKC
jgi:hypothetical protein